MRTEAERRHHRARVIHNRMKLILNALGGGWGLGNRGPGALDKDHLTNCSCWMCKPHKHEPKVRQRDWFHLLHE